MRSAGNSARSRGERQAAARRDERSDDQGLAAVAVGEHAPEREEQETDDVRADGDQADGDGNVVGGDADRRQMERGECGELAIGDDLDERGEGEEGEHAAPAGRGGHRLRDYSAVLKLERVAGTRTRAPALGMPFASTTTHPRSSSDSIARAIRLFLRATWPSGTLGLFSADDN